MVYILKIIILLSIYLLNSLKVEFVLNNNCFLAGYTSTKAMEFNSDVLGENAILRK